MDEAFRQHVVVIPALPKQFASETLEVFFRALGAFGLQFPSQTKDPPFLCFPATFSEEVMRRGDGRAGLTQINTNHRRSWFDDWCRNAHHDMQPEAPFPVTQLGTTDLVTEGLLCVPVHYHGNLKSSCNGSQATGQGLPVHPIAAGIVADRADLRFRGPLRGRPELRPRHLGLLRRPHALPHGF